MTQNYSPVYTEEINVKSDENSIFPKHIETSRLRFKDLKSSISPERLFDIMKNNPDIDEYFDSTMGFPNTIGEMYQYYDSIREMEEEKSDKFYALFHRKDNEFVGCATIEDCNFHKQKCGIGIWLREDSWGRNISQERAEGLIHAIFTTMPIETIQIRVSTENVNSISAVQKYIKEFGGSYDGLLRNDLITPNYKVTDVLSWSLTKSEFYSTESEYSRNIKQPNEFID